METERAETMPLRTWVAIINTDDGPIVTVSTTEERSFIAIMQYVKLWWPFGELGKRIKDQDAAIHDYFHSEYARDCHESYEVEEHIIQGT